MNREPTSHLDEGASADVAPDGPRTFLSPVMIVAIMLVLLVVVFTGFSFLVKLSSSVIAAGTVVVQGSVKTIQHAEGGIISRILVADGDVVQTGMVLVQLDASRQQTTIASIKPQIALLSAETARLRTELSGGSHIEFSVDEGDVTLAEFPAIAKDQEATFHARVDALALQLRGFESEQQQDVEAVRGLENQLAALQKRAKLSELDVSAAAQLQARGYATKRSLRDDQSQAEALNGEMATVTGRINELKKRLEHVAIESQRAAAYFKQQDLEELQQIVKQRLELIDRLAQATKTLEQSSIRSPVSGRVVNLVYHSVDGVIAPGAPIMEIVPEGQPLLIEAHIRPSDADDVEIGNPVRVTVEGQGSQRLPTVAGRVVYVSADRINDKQTSTAFFLVRAEVDRQKLAAVRGGVDLKPGIPVEVMIAKKGKTLADYVTGPLLSAFTNSLTE